MSQATSAFNRVISAARLVSAKFFPKKEVQYFAMNSRMAPKYSEIGFDRMMALYREHGLPSQSLEDYVAENVGTPKTKAWAKRSREESQRRQY